MLMTSTTGWNLRSCRIWWTSRRFSSTLWGRRRPFWRWRSRLRNL